MMGNLILNSQPNPVGTSAHPIFGKFKDQDLEILEFDLIWTLGVVQGLETLEFDQIWKSRVVQNSATWS